MASEKNRGRNQHDKSRNDNDISTITNVPHRSEELKMTSQNFQCNRAKQQYVENEELDGNQQGLLRQEAMPPPTAIRRETLYARFNRLGPKEFKGSTDPYEAEDWLQSTQAILEVMELSDKEKILCATLMLKGEARYWWGVVKERSDVSLMTWVEFVIEFNQKYFNPEYMRTQQTEFLNLKQEQMTVTEAVRKFERLERLCPFLKLGEGERIRRMLEMFRPDIAIFVETCRQPATVTECYERALRAEFRLNQMKEEKAKKCERGRRNKGSSSKVATNSSNSGQDYKKKAKFSDLRSQKVCSKKRSYVLKAYCRKCRHNHAGVCRKKNITCFHCEGKGHLARNCPNKETNEDKKTH